MNMIRAFCILGVSLFLLIGGSEVFSAPVYTPASQIYMTGQSLSGGVVQARFDVASVLEGNSALITPAHLETSSKTFSGTFYLSGAGWVDISGVKLSCSQSLSNLTLPCSLSGIAQSEVVGDVLFDGGTIKKIQYLPNLGTLSGTISSNIGDFSLSGVLLPLKSTRFTSMATSGNVDANKNFIIKNPVNFASSGGLWKVDFTPVGTSFPSMGTSVDQNLTVDLSLAATYDIKITDPNGSTTLFPAYYTTKSLAPSFGLIAGSFIQNFCNTVALPNSNCPDGAILSPSILSKNGSSPVVADGNSFYDFTLKLRDQYGNRVTDGSVEFQYDSSVYLEQSPDEHLGRGVPYSALKGKNENTVDPLIFSPTITAGADITYGFASYSPTLASDSLILSTLKYKDTSGVSSDLISSVNDTTKRVEFSPLLSTSITPPSDLIIGKETLYQIQHTPPTSGVPITNQKDILLFFIGDIGDAGLDSLSSDTFECSKNAQDSPVPAPSECNWGYFTDKLSSPSVLTTTDTSFSGTYIPYVIDPDLEEVTYRSYISYVIDGNTVIYPSTAGSLGNAQYDDSLVKVFGQNNVGKQYGGINVGNGAEKWNKIHKNIMNLSRNRTNYDDVDYEILSTPKDVLSTYFTDTIHKKKRSLIVVGQDITIKENIFKDPDHPLSIMALTDSDGNGGSIFIDPSVKDIAASLFAERAIQSSNPASSDNQLSILGSVVSRNTMGETLSKICPFFVSSVCTDSEAKKYDLEKIREGYAHLSTKTGHEATLGRALTYPNTAVLIEYDGRIQFDPPAGF